MGSSVSVVLSTSIIFGLLIVRFRTLSGAAHQATQSTHPLVNEPLKGCKHRYMARPYLFHNHLVPICHIALRDCSVEFRNKVVSSLSLLLSNKSFCL